MLLNEYERNDMSVSYPSYLIPEYMKGMLSGNGCAGLTDMYMVENGDETEIMYDTRGLTELSAFRNVVFADMTAGLDIIIKMLCAVKECAGYLISSDAISYDPRNIYIDASCRSVRFVYIPGFFREDGLRQGITSILSGIAEESGLDEDIETVSTLKRIMYVSEPDTDELMRIIKNMMRGIKERVYSRKNDDLSACLTPSSGTSDMYPTYEASSGSKDAPQKVQETNFLARTWDDFTHILKGCGILKRKSEKTGDDKLTVFF